MRKPPQQLRPWNQHKKSFVYHFFFSALWFVFFNAFLWIFPKQILHSCCGFTLVSNAFPEEVCKVCGTGSWVFPRKMLPFPLVIRIHLSKQPCLLSGLFFCCSTHFCLLFTWLWLGWEEKIYGFYREGVLQQYHKVLLCLLKM